MSRVTVNVAENTIPMKELQYGQFARHPSGGVVFRQFSFRGKGRFIWLKESGSVDGYDVDCSLLVTLLPAGSSFTVHISEP